VRAAAIQMNSTADPAANLEAACRLVRQAGAEGAGLVVLPEKWLVLGSGEELRAGAEPLDGPAVGAMRELARELRVDLVAGSISEHRGEGERMGNTCLHVGPDGEVAATYRKLHLFDVEVGGRDYRESEHEQPGELVETATMADGTVLGLTICFDLRFPELYRALALLGARVFCVPSAFTLATTRDHWEVLLRARAIEQQCFVVAANQFGTHGGGMESGGQSMIVGPWGDVLARAPEHGEAVLVAELDLGSQEELRATMPVFEARRGDVYADPGPIIEQ
jgi:predicted amidohydrolase